MKHHVIVLKFYLAMYQHAKGLTSGEKGTDMNSKSAPWLHLCSRVRIEVTPKSPLLPSPAGNRTICFLNALIPILQVTVAFLWG